MIAMSVSEAAAAMHGLLQGADGEFSGVSTDTRQLRSGELFFALQGPNFDGHDMCAEAIKKGARACVVHQQVPEVTRVVVEDTRKALGQLAAYWRDQMTVKIVGITGSNGKTTVKELVAAILEQVGSVLASRGNFNNDIGVPKTLFEIDESHEYGVIEMGANHAGEIAYLSSLAKPNIVMVTLCAPAHLEGFGSIEGVAQAKGEIYSSLDDDGVAIINADDPFASYWRGLVNNKSLIEFGKNAWVSAENVSHCGVGGGSRFELCIGEQKANVDLCLDGDHNIQNALAAAAAAHGLGIDISVITAGLQSMKKVPGRLNVEQINPSLTIIDDTYNANPTSLKAAIDTVKNEPGARWLVLGEMGELGPAASELHRECGEYAKAANYQRLFAVGSLAKNAVEGFGEQGLYFDRQGDLIETLLNSIRLETTSPINLLIKGSRSAHMERVVEAIKAAELQIC